MSELRGARQTLDSELFESLIADRMQSIIDGSATTADVDGLVLLEIHLLTGASKNVLDAAYSGNTELFKERRQQFIKLRKSITDSVHYFAERYAVRVEALEQVIYVCETSNQLALETVGEVKLSNARKSSKHSKSTYIVRSKASGLIKIGKADNPAIRIRTISNGSGGELEVLSIIDSDIERSLHNRFKHLRERGEWFKDDGSIEFFVNSNNVSKSCLLGGDENDA